MHDFRFSITILIKQCLLIAHSQAFSRVDQMKYFRFTTATIIIWIVNKIKNCSEEVKKKHRSGWYLLYWQRWNMLNILKNEEWRSPTLHRNTAIYKCTRERVISDQCRRSLQKKKKSKLNSSCMGRRLRLGHCRCEDEMPHLQLFSIFVWNYGGQPYASNCHYRHWLRF